MTYLTVTSTELHGPKVATSGIETFASPFKVHGH